MTVRKAFARYLQRVTGTPRGGALLASGLVLILLLPIWWWVGRWYQDRLLAEQRTEVAAETVVRANALSLAITRRLARLQGLYAFVQTRPTDDIAQSFDEFAAQLYAGSRGIHFLVLAPEGTIRFIYPREPNADMIGYDVFADLPPDIQDDVQRSLRLGIITLSEPQELPQEGMGFMAWLAADREGGSWDLLGIALNLTPLLNEASLDLPSDELDFALRTHSGQVFFGKPEVFELDPVVHPVDLPEGTWELAGVPSNGWLAAVQRPVLIYRLGGLIIIALMAGLVYLSVNRQARLSQAVKERTQAITSINRELEQRVQERTGELATLLDVSHSVASTLQLEPLLALILDNLKKVVDYDTAAVFLLKDDPPVLSLLDYRGSPPPGELDWSRNLPNLEYVEEIIYRRKPVIIPDIHAQTGFADAWRQSGPATDNESADHKGSWMGVPLIIKDKAIGMLAFEHKQANTYTSRHADLALAFAHQAALAIENARLYEQAQQIAALRERQKLARELHDSVSQILYGIALSARTAREQLKRDPSKAARPLEYVLSMAEAGLTDMKALIFELRPESLRDEGLVAALKKQAAALRSRLNIDVHAGLDQEPSLSLDAKEALYRIAQEALQNVIKHADASRVEMRLGVQNGSVVLEVKDDGVGFDTEASYPGHLGLHTMNERVQEHGGTLEIDSTLGSGTIIRALIPATKG